MGTDTALLKGAEVSAKIKEQVTEELKKLQGFPIKLAIIRVGERPDDLSYERGAKKKLDSFGLSAESYVFPEDITDQEFKEAFRRINQDEEITGILLLRPLPKQICEGDIEEMIDPRKDLDGISPKNIAKVFAGDETGFAPCTAEAVIQVLKAYHIPLEGKRVVIVGRSMVVGRPLSMLMLKENATVTICHTRTRDLKETCRNGINVDEDGKLCGDVDIASISGKASMATPVPGGVGAVTTAVLAQHLVRAAGILYRKQ